GHAPVVNAAYGTAGVAACAVLQAIVSLTVARAFGPGLFGQYAVLLASSYLVAMVSDAGLCNLIVPAVAGAPEATGRSLKSALWAKAPLAAVSALIGAFVLPYVAVTGAMRAGFWLMWGANVLQFIQALLVGYFRGSRRMDLELVVGVTQSLALLALVVAAIR